MAKISSLLLEATTVNFKGQSFTLVLDTNEDPKKKGVKIQFVPAAFAQLSPQERDDIAIALEQKLDTGLQKVGLKVERDRQLKDPNIIGFFIYIEYLDRIVRKVLQGAQ
jgi:hypothetical protein